MLGVIIPTQNHWPYAARTARSLLASTPDAIAIVIDDASTDWEPDYPARLQSLGPGRVIVQRYPKQAGMTRSWNAGLRICRAMGIEYAAPANSDLVFSALWWQGAKSALREADFVGPITNAPGHSPRQQVAEWVPGYSVSDDAAAINGLCAQCLCLPAGEATTRLNGFCVVGRTEAFWRHSRTPTDCYDPAIPMAGNEDEFFARAKAKGASLAVAPQSFVFHYRGISRGERKGLDAGSMRADGLPEIESLAVAKPAKPQAKRLRPECVHLGRMVDGVAGLAPCKQKRVCGFFGREVRRCEDCETCDKFEAV